MRMARTKIHEAILEGPNSDADGDELHGIEVVNAVSKAFQPHLVPKPSALSNSSIQSCRADYILTFREKTSTFYEFFHRIRRPDPPFQLSPINDESNRDSVLGCVIEVKSESKGYLEALMRLTITSFATMERLRLNGPASGSASAIDGSWLEQQLPFPSISVVGLNWDIHWMYWESENSLVMLGPFRIGSMGSFAEIYALVEAIDRLKRWLRDTYWDWLVSRYDCKEQQSAIVELQVAGPVDGRECDD